MSPEMPAPYVVILGNVAAAAGTDADIEEEAEEEVSTNRVIRRDRYRRAA